MTSQLERLCNRHNIRISSEWSDENPNMSNMPPGSTHYKVTLRRTLADGSRRQITAYYSQGPAVCCDPETADVLYCLISDARCGDQTFEDFCWELGSEGTLREYKTWKVCAKMAPKVARFLDSDFDTFANAEH
jgi:hypothetical protein